MISKHIIRGLCQQIKVHQGSMDREQLPIKLELLQLEEMKKERPEADKVKRARQCTTSNRMIMLSM